MRPPRSVGLLSAPEIARPVVVEVPKPISSLWQCGPTGRSRDWGAARRVLRIQKVARFGFGMFGTKEARIPEDKKGVWSTLSTSH